ncbi:MAG: 50S ribosomal protein L16 [candidate division TM6 bacterium GW2011_GWF2_30_66]|jgi:large subunit ribosomal protein L16|nr:MAG: 50S ribosomal protein L16 [candidate division TM6 bacterium GW2011_GWF2_30_66]
MLMPKKVKWRKQQRGTRKGRSKGARELEFGDYGVQALECCWLSAQQIESMRVSISRKTKKVGKMFLRVFPDKPVTKKPAETRMGKGKGNIEMWVSVVKRERIIFELSGVTEQVAREICKAAAYKLPIKVKFIKREEQNMQEQQV